MSVKIRLKRAGARHRPFYRIVVTDSRMPRDGRFIVSVGTYDPLAAGENVKVDGELVKDWIRKGAKPSLAVTHLLRRAGVVVREVPVKTETASPAVSLDELREAGVEEPAQPTEEPSLVKTKVARAKKKASSKPKPARKGATRKAKST